MKTDPELRADVIAELCWEAAINTVGVDVVVRGGVVTLTGPVATFAEKYEIERAVRRVSGVRRIALALDVNLSADHMRSDADIAQAAVLALQWNSQVPHDRLTVEVEDGWVTLFGEVDWSCQLASAESCLRSLVGVRELVTHVTIQPQVNANNIGADIHAALTRQAGREVKQIGIEVNGGVVTIRGKVHSLAERAAALGAAFAARGVSRVVDRLEIAA